MRLQQFQKDSQPQVYSKPTDEDIDETFAILRKKLSMKAMNRNDNFAVKEGYTKAVELLEGRITDLSLSSIGLLKTVQGRFIAGMAMDYLRGFVTQQTLVNIPIRR